MDRGWWLSSAPPSIFALFGDRSNPHNFLSASMPITPLSPDIPPLLRTSAYIVQCLNIQIFPFPADKHQLTHVSVYSLLCSNWIVHLKNDIFRQWTGRLEKTHLIDSKTRCSLDDVRFSLTMLHSIVFISNVNVRVFICNLSCNSYIIDRLHILLLY